MRDFRKVVTRNRWNLTDGAGARGMCGTVSAAFAEAVVNAGYEAKGAKLEWKALFVAVPIHYAVEVEGRIYDWTVTQFKEGADVPSVYPSLSAWAQALEAEVPAGNGRPVTSTFPVTC